MIPSDSTGFSQTGDKSYIDNHIETAYSIEDLHQHSIGTTNVQDALRHFTHLRMEIVLLFVSFV